MQCVNQPWHTKEWWEEEWKPLPYLTALIMIAGAKATLLGHRTLLLRGSGFFQEFTTEQNVTSPPPPPLSHFAPLLCEATALGEVNDIAHNHTGRNQVGPCLISAKQCA